MKLIIAIIKPFKIDDVRQAVIDTGIVGMTVRDVQGFGRQNGHAEIYRGSEYMVQFLPKIEIQVTVPDDKCKEVIAAITKAARTGKIGDGKIFVINIEEVIRIRTGETGDSAIS